MGFWLLHGKKDLLFKCAPVSGTLEMLPSQLPCPLSSLLSAALHLRPWAGPSPPIPQSLALNLINRCKLNRLPEPQKEPGRDHQRSCSPFLRATLAVLPVFLSADICAVSNQCCICYCSTGTPCSPQLRAPAAPSSHFVLLSGWQTSGCDISLCAELWLAATSPK